MEDHWKRIVAHFASSLLDRPPCDCALTDWEYWREDLALAGGSDATGNQTGLFRAVDSDLDNPFGTRRGMLAAWRAVKREGMVGAVLA